jgi:hypothetical protein
MTIKYYENTKHLKISCWHNYDQKDIILHSTFRKKITFAIKTALILKSDSN